MPMRRIALLTGLVFAPLGTSIRTQPNRRTRHWPPSWRTTPGREPSIVLAPWSHFRGRDAKTSRHQTDLFSTNNAGRYRTRRSFVRCPPDNSRGMVRERYPACIQTSRRVALADNVGGRVGALETRRKGPPRRWCLPVLTRGRLTLAGQDQLRHVYADWAKKFSVQLKRFACPALRPDFLLTGVSAGGFVRFASRTLSVLPFAQS
jgi:hypothetical protein